MVIDHLMDQYAKEDANVIYIYFDYKSQTKQTEVDIVSALLKQVLCRITDIPADIQSFYNDSVVANKKPMNDLIRFLTLHSKSRTYAVFDALDECDDKYQQGMLSLFGMLEKTGFKLLISMRPHMKVDSDYLISVDTVTIEANVTDLENYVIVFLEQKKNKNNELKRRCLELVKEAEGM